MNFLIDTTWWAELTIQTIASGLILLLIKKTYTTFSSKITNPFNKKGIIGRFIRYFDLKNLKKIRVILRDDAKITREITKNYAYLIIFTLSMMIYFWLIICLTILSKEFRIYTNSEIWVYNIFVLIVGSPMYIFEILFLNQNNYLKKIFKYKR